MDNLRRNRTALHRPALLASLSKRSGHESAQSEWIAVDLLDTLALRVSLYLDLLCPLSL